jgi:CHASE3 domain sensor protein
MLNSLKIGTKLAVGFGVAIAMILLLNVVSLTNISSMDDNMTTVFQIQYGQITILML